MSVDPLRKGPLFTHKSDKSDTLWSIIPTLVGISMSNFRDLSHERESSEQFVWYGETETQLRRGAIMPSIEPIGVKMK
jgi:hypothetical protein